MDPADDGTRTARSLAEWLDALHFADLTTAQATARVVDAVAEWGAAQGWRVYRRAPSVFPLPPPLTGSSVLDVACARPGAPPIVLEVDRLDRARTVDKLLAEAAAGRMAVWVRWGAGPFAPPPLPVHMVTRAAARRRGTWHTVADRPPPPHSAAPLDASAPAELPWGELGGGQPGGGQPGGGQPGGGRPGGGRPDGERPDGGPPDGGRPAQ